MHIEAHFTILPLTLCALGAAEVAQDSAKAAKAAKKKAKKKSKAGMSAITATPIETEVADSSDCDVAAPDATDDERIAPAGAAPAQGGPGRAHVDTQRSAHATAGRGALACTAGNVAASAYTNAFGLLTDGGSPRDDTAAWIALPSKKNSKQQRTAKASVSAASGQRSTSDATNTGKGAPKAHGAASAHGSTRAAGNAAGNPHHRRMLSGNAQAEASWQPPQRSLEGAPASRSSSGRQHAGTQSKSRSGAGAAPAPAQAVSSGALLANSSWGRASLEAVRGSARQPAPKVRSTLDASPSQALERVPANEQESAWQCRAATPTAIPPAQQQPRAQHAAAASPNLVDGDLSGEASIWGSHTAGGPGASWRAAHDAVSTSPSVSSAATNAMPGSQDLAHAWWPGTCSPALHSGLGHSAAQHRAHTAAIELSSTPPASVSRHADLSGERRRSGLVWGADMSMDLHASTTAAISCNVQSPAVWQPPIGTPQATLGHASLWGEGRGQGTIVQPDDWRVDGAAAASQPAGSVWATASVEPHGHALRQRRERAQLRDDEVARLKAELREEMSFEMDGRLQAMMSQMQQLTATSPSTRDAPAGQPHAQWSDLATRNALDSVDWGMNAGSPAAHASVGWSPLQVGGSQEWRGVGGSPVSDGPSLGSIVRNAIDEDAPAPAPAPAPQRACAPRVAPEQPQAARGAGRPGRELTPWTDNDGFAWTSSGARDREVQGFGSRAAGTGNTDQGGVGWMGAGSEPEWALPAPGEHDALGALRDGQFIC
jgi:hypothetical protein